MFRKFATVLCACVLLPATAWSHVYLQGDEFRLFIRETDELKLIEFEGSINSRVGDVTGLTCNLEAAAVALVGTDVEVSRYLAMLLASQAANIPIRVFLNNGFGAGGLCTVDTIRMGFIPL